MKFVRIFTRKTSSTNFIPEIDGLRFISILTVLVYHLNSALAHNIGVLDYGNVELGGSESFLSIGWWIVRLDLGVKLFFSISGFILAVPFIKARMKGIKMELYPYFKRRFLRLEPPFIITLLIFFILQKFFFDYKIENIENHLLVGIFYLHGFFYGIPNPINPVTWSLEVETQFYVLVPLLFVLVRKLKKKYSIIILFVTLMVIGLFFKNYIHDEKLSHFIGSIFFFITHFVTGIIFAFVFLKYKTRWEKHKQIIWDIIGVLALLLMFISYKPQSVWYYNLLFNCNVFLLLIAAFKSVIFNKFLRIKFVYLIGGMCYSIYLIHYAVLFYIVKFNLSFFSFESYKVNLLIQSIIALPLVIIISSIFYLVIERPCMDKNWPTKLKSFIVKKLTVLKR